MFSVITGRKRKVSESKSNHRAHLWDNKSREGLPAILMPDTGSDECGTVVRVFAKSGRNLIKELSM
jgi:hypothetical protein